MHGHGQESVPIDDDSSSSPSDSELLCQIGSGDSRQDPNFIEKVALLVSKKLQPWLS